MIGYDRRRAAEPEQKRSNVRCEFCKESRAEFCRRCRPAEFMAEFEKVKFGVLRWVTSLKLDPFGDLLVCDHCGHQRARSDGFCGHCAAPGGAERYVSFQVIAGRDLSNPSQWSQKKPAQAPVLVTPEPAPKAEQLTLLGGPVVESKRRRSKR